MSLSRTPAPKKRRPTQQPLPVDQGYKPNLISDVADITERYGWDILGVLLLLVSLLSILALTGLSTGSFISPWGGLLKQWFGIGAFVLAPTLGLLGILALMKRTGRTLGLNFKQVISIEAFVFSLMIFLALCSKLSVSRAEAGMDGGMVGWGLAAIINKVLPHPWGMVLFVPVLLALAHYGSGLGFGGIEKIRVLLQSLRKKVPVELIPPKIHNTNPVEIVGNGDSVLPVYSFDTNETIEEIKSATPDSTAKVNLPDISLLLKDELTGVSEDRIVALAEKVEQTLDEFGIPSKVIGYRVGPTVTQFAVEPGYLSKVGPDGEVQQQKIRVSQISNLSRDLALALSAERIRIEAPVPGHSYVGIEIPNSSTQSVRLRSLLESPEYLKIKSSLALALGRDVSGAPVVADLSRMPHLMIAGTTGSGKSIMLIAIIATLAMNNTPDELRMAILDPKRVELSRFNQLPHILGNVETQPERMQAVLTWAISEMDSRYRLLESAGTRDLSSYNASLQKRNQKPLPRIVVLIDELADLMTSMPGQTEYSLVRLAQMARAVGIHLVVATQRPSTDVVTGLIKANFPSRIAFAVASAIDSRVILDVNGAETLLGKGDMLFLNPEVGSPQRAQGVMLTDEELQNIIHYWKETIPPAVVPESPWDSMVTEAAEDAGGDDMVEQAIELVRRSGKASASLLQRRLRVGFPRAARLLDQLEEMGVVGPSLGGGKDREVLPFDEEDPSEF